MTKFLASVTGPAEAAVAVAGGADIVDLKDPARGALGAVAADAVRETVRQVAGARPVSAVLGDLPMRPQVIEAAAAAMADAGVQYVKCGVFPGDGDPHACLRALATLAGRVRLIAVLFADQAPDVTLLDTAAESGFAGAMLDTADKASGRLLSHQDLTALDRFVTACRARGLMAGLAGALEAPDVPRLLVLSPDFLGFRGALCGAGGREALIDAGSVAAIRALIPPEGVRTADLRLLAARAYAPPARDARSDRVFVRDLVLPARVGAYAAEYAAPQRVRFTVELCITPAQKPAAGMVDVFSYDIITDGIRMLLAQGHVALLETLAERIAALLLAHGAVRHVSVRLEKLDVHAESGGGVVGCVVERGAPT